MAQGWVYVLVNSSVPGMVKVGCTTKPPMDRAAELSGVTGVATPFVVAFDQAFADCRAAEKTIHDELDRRGLRVAPNREFFRGSPSDVIRLVLDAADHAAPVHRAMTDISAGSLLEAGDRCLSGAGPTLQDTGEAVRFYKLAAARGSLRAFDRLGRIYVRLYGARQDRAARRRALATLKEGIRRGNYYCYPEMAMLFAIEQHVENFNKAWQLFFLTRTRSPAGDVEGGMNEFHRACCRYIGACLGLGLPPQRRDEFSASASDLIGLLLADLDRAKENPSARRRVFGTLRWVYQHLLPDLTPASELRPRKARAAPSFWIQSSPAEA